MIYDGVAVTGANRKSSNKITKSEIAKANRESQIANRN
jgi:hypothetical protein